MFAKKNEYNACFTNSKQIFINQISIIFRLCLCLTNSRLWYKTYPLQHSLMKHKRGHKFFLLHLINFAGFTLLFLLQI